MDQHIELSIGEIDWNSIHPFFHGLYNQITILL